MNLLKYLISKKYREVYSNEYTRKIIEKYNNEISAIEDIYRTIEIEKRSKAA
ncbi:hypothetical protein [Clostridium paridis]|uniref:Uncharacterized protein n=1 Tax=Clostridium paridis TaxID=2803863 RepID=A0A937K637_9CLOT|nr:hypothetical protein [Clostridium paridis]MBL4933824.1 hypothetical protein [Clostridium paridis]